MQLNGETNFRVTALTLTLFLSAAIALGQTKMQGTQVPSKPSDPMSADKSAPSEDGPPLTTFEEEMRAKRAIKLAEKEHRQNLDRAKEISQIAKDLQQGLKDKSVLGTDHLKQLDRLEKLTKKIRGEAGGEPDEVQIVDRPTTITAAATKIAEVAETLSSNVQKTPRQVVSASVIDSANVLLELIRVLRAFSPKV